MLEQLAPNVYYAPSMGNVGFIDTPLGGLLIDTPMVPADARQLRQELIQLSPRPLLGIVNTDYHPEHIFGNSVFMPVRTFGHELSAKPIAKYATSTLAQVAGRFQDTDPALAAEIAALTIASPEVCVGDRVVIHTGETEIHILYLEGHTPASLGVYLPDSRILFAGDNVTNNRHPSMYQASTLAWLDTLRRIDGLEIDTIVPAEGEPCNKDVIPPLHAYISEMHSRTLERFLAGASRRECVEKVGMLDWFPIARYEEALMKRRRRESVERVYTEIRIAHRKKR